jgi:pimeloyl-ACP methyl ester carboxylesterase
MAKLIPGAELLIVEGMGHHFPEQRYDVLADAIQRMAKRGSGGKS